MTASGLWASLLEALAQDAGLRFLLDWYWRASVLLLLAFALTALMRRCPAAFRHAVWLGCLAALALLPAGMLLLPELRVGLPGLPALRPFAAASAGSGLLLVYAALAAVLLAGLLLGLWHMARLTRAATAAGERERALLADLLAERDLTRPVGLRVSHDLRGPLSWGLRRPVILLPAAADWPREELLQVLQHELAHVERLDWAGLLLARLVCLLYCCHPLAWLAARRLEEEAERACDDTVLLSGGDEGAYAGLLLRFARRLAGQQADAAAQAMAQSFLARRVLAILGRDVRRAPSEGIHLLRALLFALPPLLVLAALELVPEFDQAARYLGLGQLIEVQLAPPQD